MYKIIDTQTGEERVCIRYKDGKQRYGICQSTFEKRAKEAGAIIKMGKVVLVDVAVFEKYLFSFRLPANY